MSLKLPTLYKKLLILALVFGPIVWLMFTDDGQRRTDTVVLWLFGEKEIKMDLQVLDHQFSEQDLKQVYPDLDWQCQTHRTPYGDRLCVSRIGIFNGIPARYISLFFRDDRVTAMKLNYREQHHAQFQEQLRRQLGKPELEPRSSPSTPSTDKTLQWRTQFGILIMKRELLAEEEPALFWLADTKLSK